jgi:hypothetical protein
MGTLRAGRVACAALAALAAILLVAAAAQAARVTDLRVGVHDDYTRVVLETDASVEPRVDRTDTEVVVRLDAGSAPRAVAVAKSRIVESVRVTPTNGGSEVRIRLRQPAAVKQFALRSPDRLVFDLSQAAPGAAAAPPPAAEPEPAEPEAPAPRAATPPPAPPPRAAPEPAPADAGVDEGTPEAEPEPGIGMASDFEEGLEGEVGLAEPEERELLEGGRMAATSPPDEEAEAEATPRTDQPMPMPKPVPPPARDGGALDFLPAPLDQPLTLVILAVLLVGLFVLSRMRGRRAQAARLSPFDAEDVGEPLGGPTAPEQVEEAERQGAAPADDEDEYPAPRVHATGSAVAGDDDKQPSIFDEPAPAAGAGGSTMDTPAGTAIGDAGARAATGAASGLAGAGAPVDELERRLAHLEQRLEELVDAKERLERQVAAQTEELRVQRAAIARTQRVLRGMARPEDEASEPVPRT